MGADGETLGGESIDGESADGESIDGESADGESIDGESADGESIDGDDALLRTLVENTSSGVLAIDSAGRIVFANPAIERILGYSPEELTGDSVLKIVPERHRGTQGAALDAYLEPGGARGDLTGVDLALLHSDGHEVTVAASLREQAYRGDRLVSAVFADVTERRRRERRRRERKRELEEFADVLAHDLQGPLTVARTYTEQARETGDTDPLRGVQNALGRMEQLIDEMLAHTRDGEGLGTMEVMPLRDVTRAAWDSVLTCDADLVEPDPRWRLRAHRGRLRQLAENLVRNAVEHGGSAVTVRVGVLDDERGFYVEDDGYGLPDAVRAGLASPDDRARIEQCGYGLRIVETIAREHGWTLRPAESAEGGARFEFDGATVFRG